MTKPHKLTGVMKLLNLDDNRDAVHWEVRRGSEQQAVNYCTKEETRRPATQPTNLGEDTQQGKRSGAASGESTP